MSINRKKDKADGILKEHGITQNDRQNKMDECQKYCVEQKKPETSTYGVIPLMQNSKSSKTMIK